MKFSLTILIAISLFSCGVKKNNEQTTLTRGNSEIFADNKFHISSTGATSYEVEQFAEEIQRRQAINPDKIFEVVTQKPEPQDSHFMVSAIKDKNLYKNKNFYLFIGLGQDQKDEAILRTDWNALYTIMGYLAKNHFRVLINVQATVEHLKEAVEDKETSIILWSSHGNKSAFYDFNKQAVPYDIFKNKSPSMYQFILASCEGRIALDEHYNIKGLKTWAWSKVTNSIELRDFLMSDKWNALEK